MKVIFSRLATRELDDAANFYEMEFVSNTLIM